MSIGKKLAEAPEELIRYYDKTPRIFTKFLLLTILSVIAAMKERRKNIA